MAVGTSVATTSSRTFLIVVYLCKYIIVEHKLINMGYIFITAIDQFKNYINQITTS